MKMTTSAPPSELDSCRREFEAFARSRPVPPWLADLRRTGISHFTELGYPTQQQEEWIFTNVRPIVELPFQRASAAGAIQTDLAAFEFAGLDGIRLTFVDGHFVPALSRVEAVPAGIVAGDLCSAIDRQGERVAGHLGRHARTDASGFSALNTAFIQDGAFIHLEAGRELEQPVHLLFLSTGTGNHTAHVRNLIVAAPNARARVIESHYSLGDNPHLTNAVTEVIVAEGAHVEHCKFQEQNTASFHVATIQAHLAKASRFVSHSISTGARIARNDINLVLAGDGVDAVLNGLYVVGGRQLVDHHTLADHAMPRCGSHEFYHGILGGQSRGVFNGKIYVRQDAQKTDAKQTSRNILLTDQAVVNAKPQLEIFADDVKCTHGATVGQLNRDAVFYCRSRGIDEANARRLLTHAFAGEVIERITIEPVRAHLEKLLWDRLEELIEE